MKSMLDFLTREPAMVVAIVLATLNMVWALNTEQQMHVEVIVQSLMVILGGGVVRQNVKPMVTVREDDIEHAAELAKARLEP